MKNLLIIFLFLFFSCKKEKTSVSNGTAIVTYKTFGAKNVYEITWTKWVNGYYFTETRNCNSDTSINISIEHDRTPQIDACGLAVFDTAITAQVYLNGILKHENTNPHGCSVAFFYYPY